MRLIIWQQLGVLGLAVLFALLFTSMNNREQYARKRERKT